MENNDEIIKNKRSYVKRQLLLEPKNYNDYFNKYYHTVAKNKRKNDYIKNKKITDIPTIEDILDDATKREYSYLKQMYYYYCKKFDMTVDDDDYEKYNLEFNVLNRFVICKYKLNLKRNTELIEKKKNVSGEGL